MERSQTSGEYRIRVHASAAEVDAPSWNELLARQHRPTPFMRHEMLAAMEASGSADASTGWQPSWLTLQSGSRLVAGCPLYLKSHSFGEYVFDWSWAEAWRRQGLAYYPKALIAVPFTPVPGTRLLAEGEAWRARLIDAIERLVAEAGLSSAHLLFGDEADLAALHRAGWSLRHGLQFHWRQDAERPIGSFDELLSRLQRDKRKKIMQERRRVADSGVRFRVLQGDQIGGREWDFFHLCYTLTYRAHRSHPYLTRDFFARMAREMAGHWVMFLAQSGDEWVGCSLITVDTERRAAWGRYWGATRFVPCLHFEACYYQPLAWCLALGIDRFEGGAQGEHKMARGLLPVTTLSAHWVADPAMRGAVARALAAERAGLAEHVDELNERTPFKATEA